MMERALVTGGAGFIGSHVVQELEKRDYDVVIADLSGCQYDTDSRFIYLDVTNNIQGYLDTISTVDQDFDVVFHCAGLLGTETLLSRTVQAVDVNIRGTVNILEWAKEIGAVVVQPNLIGEWLNTYMITKQCAETFGFMYAEVFGVRYLSIRPTDVYGPRQSRDEGKAAPAFIISALRDDPISICGSGFALVNYVYVKDVARYVVDMYEAGETGGPFVFACPGGNMTVREFANLIIRLAESKSTIKFISMRKGQPDYTEEHPYDNLDLDLPSYLFSDLETTFLETIDWYRRFASDDSC